MHFRAFIFCCGLMASVSGAHAEPVKIIAAENFYGDIARQIGGSHVEVRAILTNPDQDPHLFEASPSLARELGKARIVILNGAGYDDWMDRLIKAMPNAARNVINVAGLVKTSAGANPHLWYNLDNIALTATALTSALDRSDPVNSQEFDQNLAKFQVELSLLKAKIATLRQKYQGTPITASEPVFGYMAAALGFEMHNQPFQLAVMNNTEPSVSDVAAFEHDLFAHQVKLMLFNAQAASPAVMRLVNIAKSTKIPVIGITETAPDNTTYQVWMNRQLDEIDRALAP